MMTLKEERNMLIRTGQKTAATVSCISRRSITSFLISFSAEVKYIKKCVIAVRQSVEALNWRRICFPASSKINYLLCKMAEGVIPADSKI